MGCCWWSLVNVLFAYHIAFPNEDVILKRQLKTLIGEQGHRYMQQSTASRPSFGTLRCSPEINRHILNFLIEFADYHNDRRIPAQLANITTDFSTSYL
ncbi:hypothetical protein M758_4G202900 [Ceratodon purpureus]|nr:hypothetical protein M758_4G202900 [Ceratodon purpureus]